MSELNFADDDAVVTVAVEEASIGTGSITLLSYSRLSSLFEVVMICVFNET